MQHNDAISVVICSRDRASLLEQALPPVIAALRPGDDVLVVDSASRDDGVARAAAASGVRVLRCERPGVSRARNVGWRATDRPLVLFMDDDCRPDPGWVHAAAAVLADPRTGAVWGRVRADGVGVELSTTQDGGPQEYAPGGDLSAVGHGANMAFRRTTLEAVGGFDGALGAGARIPGGEDKDIFWRAVRAGWRARSAPDMAVTHVTWRGDAAALRTMYAYGVGAGAVAVKRRRLADERGLIRAELWRHGVVPALRRAKHGKYTAAAGAMARSVGVLAGAVRTRRLELDDGRYEAG